MLGMIDQTVFSGGASLNTSIISEKSSLFCIFAVCVCYMCCVCGECVVSCVCVAGDGTQALCTPGKCFTAELM